MRRPALQDPVFKFEDTAIVLFQTDYLNYQFVYAFNKACRLAMQRVDDLEIAPLEPLKPLKPLSTPQHLNPSTLQPLNTSTPQHLNNSTNQPLNPSTPQPLNTSTPQHLNTSPLPCYLYHDEASRLTFVLIDTRTPQPLNTSTPQHLNTSTPQQLNSQLSTIDPYTFMLLVRGRDAWDFQASLYHNLTDSIPEPDPTEIRQHIDWQLMREFKNNIFAVDTFCFSPQRGQSTSLPFSSQPSALRTRQSFLRRLHQLVAQTFQTLEWQLCE